MILIQELYDNQKNNKRQIQNLKKITKSKKQKVPMLYTNNQNTDDEDTNVSTSLLLLYQ